MTYDDITGAIERMAYKRYLRGATKETVILKLQKLHDITWKHSTDIRKFISCKIEEFQKLIMVRPFGDKYYLVIGNGFTKEIFISSNKEITIVQLSPPLKLPNR